MFGFPTAKAETQCRLCIARIKMQRNKRTVAIKQQRRDIAELLRVGKQALASIRVEAVIRENLMLQAYEILEQYLEQLAVRMQLVAKTKEIPPDMVQSISSIIYASQRVGEISELTALRALFVSKYGKEYCAEAANDNTSRHWEVNVNLIRCLLVEPPQAEEKLAMLSDIAQEAGVEWDLASAANEMLPPGARPSDRVGMPPLMTGPRGREQLVPVPSPPQNAGYAPPPAAWAPPGLPAHAMPQMMDPQTAAKAAADAAAYAQAMAEYASRVSAAYGQAAAGAGALGNMPTAGAPVVAQGFPQGPPQGWLAASSATPSSPLAGPDPTVPVKPAASHAGAPPLQRSDSDIQRAYEAAQGPPVKGALAPSAPPGGVPPLYSGGLPNVPQHSALPTPPSALPDAPSAVLPGTIDLPHAPQGSIPSAPEDEYDDLERRLAALKRT